MPDINIISLQDAITQLKKIKNNAEFESLLSVLKNFLKALETDSEYISELERRAYYPVNEYSNRENQINLDAAKKRVLEYLEQLVSIESKDDQLLKVLDNYYLFLESILERVPHKSGSIQKDLLTQLKPQNEYDIQYLLYAYLKPLYPMARTEVNEDTGYGTVRTDILLDSSHAIEVKYTRSNMKLKKLTEEIEADIIHYSAEYIYFFIYDREKIIDNPHIFKYTYENKIKEKKIHIVIHQPKIL